MRNIVFKVIFLLAIIAFVCEGVDDARRSRRSTWGKFRTGFQKLKSGTQRFKHKLKSGIHKGFQKLKSGIHGVGRHFTLRYIIPDYKEADWGECDGDEPKKENHCVTE